MTRTMREYLAAIVEAERYGVPSAAYAGTAAAIRTRIANAIEAERYRPLPTR